MIFTQEQMRTEAECHEGACFLDDPPSSAFTWFQEDAFSVSLLDGAVEMWREWFETERKERPDYYTEMEAWWINDHDEHLVIVECPDGSFHVWEGTHRQALSKIHGLVTIPAFVGRRAAKQREGHHGHG